MSGTDVQAVRDEFAAALRDVPPTRSAWLSYDEDSYYLWLIIEPSDMAHARKFYAVAGRLSEAFPDAHFELHVLNPRTYPDVTLERLIPSTAKPVWGAAPA